VLYAHKLTTTRSALENLVALTVLVWSRGRLVTLQILTNSSFSLVEETHGSLGQCVSFSWCITVHLVGSGFTAYAVFLFFSFLSPAVGANGICIGDTRAFHFDNRCEFVPLEALLQESGTRTNHFFFSLRLWIFLSGLQCLASPAVNPSGWRSKPIVICSKWSLQRSLPSPWTCPCVLVDSPCMKSLFLSELAHLSASWFDSRVCLLFTKTCALQTLPFFWYERLSRFDSDCRLSSFRF